MRELNITNGEQKMTDFLGRYNIFATLSLSLSLRYSPTVAHTLLRFAGDRALIYGFSCVHAREVGLFFLSPSDDSGGGGRRKETNTIINNKLNHLKQKQCL